MYLFFGLKAEFMTQKKTVRYHLCYLTGFFFATIATRVADSSVCFQCKVSELLFLPVSEFQIDKRENQGKHGIDVFAQPAVGQAYAEVEYGNANVNAVNE